MPTNREAFGFGVLDLAVCINGCCEFFVDNFTDPAEWNGLSDEIKLFLTDEVEWARVNHHKSLGGIDGKGQ